MAYWGPHDASKQFNRWKYAYRHVFRQIPEDAWVVHTYRVEGGADAVEVQVAEAYAALFDEPPRHPSG